MLCLLCGVCSLFVVLVFVVVRVSLLLFLVCCCSFVWCVVIRCLLFVVPLCVLGSALRRVYCVLCDCPCLLLVLCCFVCVVC